MGKPKFQMPRASGFLRKRTHGWAKSTPVWVFLEREMRQNEDVKPYNEKVGNWLKFLKDMKAYQKKENNHNLMRANKEAGPAWFIEFSRQQKHIIHELHHMIHQDLIEDLPKRTRKALRDLGMRQRVSTQTLMRTMVTSNEDPAVFIWYLYKEIYKMQPNQPRTSYDLDAKILMSALVVIDYDECIKELEELTKRPKPPPPPPKPKPKLYDEPKVLHGVYLQKMTAPLVSSYPSAEELKHGKEKPPEIPHKLKLRSEESLENILKDTSFIDKRIDRNKKAKLVQRVCNYKFWEPPPALRAKNKKMAAFLIKLKMFKQKVSTDYMKMKPPQENLQFHVGTVAYINGMPRMLLNGVITLPTGFIPWNGGTIPLKNGEKVTHILGYCKYPRDIVEKCDKLCDCVKKWQTPVMKYLEQSKCKCGHFYDYYHEGKPTENRYFLPPTKNIPYFFDYARIFQMDPTEDFIKDSIVEALRSKDPTPKSSAPTLDPSQLRPSVLVAALMADLADTPLVINHLPDFNKLNSLKAWARKKIKGGISPKQHKKWMLKSQRRWLQLNYHKFMTNAYFIPFTAAEKKNMTYKYLGTMRKLGKIFRRDFLRQNALKQIEFTRIFYATMRGDDYKNKAFDDMFFTYMPTRPQDIFMLRPFSLDMHCALGGKTCPLNI